MKKLMALLLVFLTVTASAAAETLRTYGISWTEAARKRMANQYPNLKIEIWEGDGAEYLTTAEFAAPLLTRTFNWDVFYLEAAYVDAQLLMEKGFLLDLSSYEKIRDIISRLHPSIADQCMRDGKIYALPLLDREPSYLQYVDMDNWLAAGYTAADIPSTFPGYLDFIEDYIERCGREPDFGYAIEGFSSEDYNPKSWPHFLTTLFHQNYECQRSYADEPLRYNDPAVVEIMERIEALCDRLWALGPRMTTDAYDLPCLFTGRFPGWDRLAETRVDLRLSEDQPRLTPMHLRMTAVNAATDKPTLAADFLVAQFMTELELFPEFGAMLFEDAEPVRNPQFDEFYAHSLNMAALCEHRLAGDDTPISEYIIPGVSSYEDTAARFRDMDDWKVEDQLTYWRNFNASLLEQEWLVSGASLAAYQAIVDEIDFIEPDLFDTTQETQTSSDRLWNQFCDGLISAREYCEQLDRMAWMMEMENR